MLGVRSWLIMSGRGKIVIRGYQPAERVLAVGRRELGRVGDPAAILAPLFVHNHHTQSCNRSTASLLMHGHGLRTADCEPQTWDSTMPPRASLQVDFSSYRRSLSPAHAGYR